MKTTEINNLQVWKTVVPLLCTLEMLQARGHVEYGTYGYHALKELSTKRLLSPAETPELDLVTIPAPTLIGESKFREGYVTSSIHRAATSKGLQICPAWVGPQICMSVQPKELMRGHPERILSVAMNPVIDHFFQLGVFKGQVLIWGKPSGDNTVTSDTRVEWVFVKPRK